MIKSDGGERVYLPNAKNMPLHKGPSLGEPRHPMILEKQEDIKKNSIIGIQFSSVTQSCLTLCDPMDCSTPGLPVHHQLLEFWKN